MNGLLKSLALVFASIFIIGCLVSCNNNEDEPRPGDEDYVNPEIPGLYEKNLSLKGTEFVYNNNKYIVQHYYNYGDAILYWSFIPHISSVDLTKYWFYSLTEVDKNLEHVKFDVPANWITDNVDSNEKYTFKEIKEYINVRNKDLISMDDYFSLSEKAREIYIYEPMLVDIYFTPYIIDGSAFDNCTNLKTVEIPLCYAIAGSSKKLFYGCKNLTDIYIGTPPYVDSKQLAVDYDKVVLHIPAGDKEIFMQEYPWKRFKNIVEDYDYRHTEQKINS